MYIKTSNQFHMFNRKLYTTNDATFDTTITYRGLALIMGLFRPSQQTQGDHLMLVHRLRRWLVHAANSKYDTYLLYF